MTTNQRPMHTGHLKYHSGCPACEMNATFISAITRIGCTEEEYDAAKETYLNGPYPEEGK